MKVKRVIEVIIFFSGRTFFFDSI